MTIAKYKFAFYIKEYNIHSIMTIMKKRDSIDISRYLNWYQHENPDYDQMVGKLSSEQVREIAIARASARLKNNEELATIVENTQWDLEITKLDIKKPKNIIINDPDTKTLDYNNDQIKNFRKWIGKHLFESNQLIKPSNKEENALMIAFREIYNSDIYDSSTIDKIRWLQKQLWFTWDDLDGEFWPKTQKKLMS